MTATDGRHGFFGRLLSVDLSTGTSRVVEFGTADARKHFLGSGLAAKILYYDFPNDMDPLDETAPLLFISGLFTGGTLPGTSKLSVCAKSPLTGIWNEATVGGHWPAEFRKTGFDGVILTGRCPELSILHMTKAGVAFQPAAGLAGKDAYEAGSALTAKFAGRAKVAVIGPAGEVGLPIASIMFDPPITRVAARSGIGAVMGAKRIKAIVVEGDPSVHLPIARPDELKAELKADIEEIRKNTVGLTNFGTSGGVEAVEKYGDLPIRNWQLGSWPEGAKKICGQAMQPLMLDKHYSCYACPIRCAKIYKNDRLGLHGHGPEYETIGMLGANCLNDDPEALAEANEWCNRYGIDTISAGAIAAFAIEAYERGIITKKDTGGLGLGWDGKTVVALVHKIGRQEDIGLTLGLGVKRAAEKLGNNASELAVHTKGLEYPAHDPRGHVGMALNYATACRGACHLEALTYFLDRGIPAADFGYTTPPNPHLSSDKPPIVVNMQNYLSVFNPLGMCKFLFVGRVGPKKIARWLQLVCGWDATMEEVLLTGERLFNLKRMYNVKLGVSRKDDILPPRLFAEAKPDGSAKDVLPDLGSMLHRYYKLRSWTADGIPTKEKLATLGIEQAACAKAYARR
ncbi:MAG: aldehyde ferredoxin oxidoreductase family protein [Elusimicrobia bacterium]|nr:aldehyde ferredoxin oxidoreductase family protein [Elusimicrobiota bacterium]